MEEQLRASWQLALPGPTGHTTAADRAFDQLLARYREPHRHYHTVKHLAYVLAAVDELVPSVPVQDPHGVRLAVFFHDAVYTPASPGNEAASAALARRVLGELGVAEDRIETTARLILCTADHEAPTGDPDAAVVLDADLAVLGAEPSVYAAYVAGVRAEHVDVDDAAWVIGRATVLRHFLDRQAIYRTPPMQGREARARANLAAELATLSGP